MSDLEQLGLVYAPHTSAGRLPTELGLRFFVDALMEIGDLTERGPPLDRGAGRRRRRGQADRDRAVRGVGAAVRADALGRRRADHQGQRAAQAHRVRAARAGAGAGGAGRRGRAGREPRHQPAGRAADVGADRGVELPQRAYPRPHAGRGQGRAGERARSRHRPSSISSRRRSSPPGSRAGRAATARTAS